MKPLTPEELKEAAANYDRILNMLNLVVLRIRDPEQGKAVYETGMAAATRFYENALSGIPGWFEMLCFFAEQVEGAALRAGALGGSQPSYAVLQ